MPNSYHTDDNVIEPIPGDDFEPFQNITHTPPPPLLSHLRR